MSEARAILFTAPVPECPDHGPMKPRTGDAGNGYTGTVYVCPGWDGEGCDYEAPPRQWSEIGIADRIEWTGGRQ